MAHDTFKAGDIEAVIGDNAGDGDHRAGYNGVWSLRHAKSSRNLFVPQYAGLNLEHIFNGDLEFDGRDKFFEPRRAAMQFKTLSATSCRLHQPPTPTFHVESTTTFTLRAPYYIDMEFRCTPHQHTHARGWFGLFWASYINGPADKSLYFQGGWRKDMAQWMQLCTQLHNDESTVRHHHDTVALDFREGSQDALFKNHSPMRYARPFYYGHFEALTYILMFDRSEGIRFTQSPSGGGRNEAFNTTNPAWDWQFIVPKYEVLKEYGFKARAVLRPSCSREEILAEYEKWQ